MTVYDAVPEIIHHPNPAIRAVRLRQGDEFVVCNTDEEVILGSKYKGLDNLIVVEILYKPKKWWQFWKKRKLSGCKIRCIKD